jgi:hypothetical protein
MSGRLGYTFETWTEQRRHPTASRTPQKPVLALLPGYIRVVHGMTRK